MTTDPHLLTLMQWLSPSYPLGAFAYSHGLEAAVAEGAVRDAGTLEGWLRDLVTCGSARSDAAFLIRAFTEDPAALNAEASAFAASAERLREAQRQGAAFVAVTRDVWALDLPVLLLPVAIGCAARQMGITPEPVAALYLQGFVINLTSAAQRLMALGQSPAQGVIARLAPDCARTAAALAKTPTPWSATWASDIAAMRHETLQPRIFQS